MRTMIGFLGLLFLSAEYPGYKVDHFFAFVSIGSLFIFALTCCMAQDVYEIKQRKENK